MISLLTQWLPTLLAPVGWCIVHFLAKKRDRQAELHKFSSEVVSFVNKIEEKSIKYHTAIHRSKQVEEEIISDLDKLEIMGDRLKKMGAKKSVPILRLRAAITLKNFQTKNFFSQEVDSYLIRDIRLSIKGIIENLYDIV